MFSEKLKKEVWGNLEYLHVFPNSRILKNVPITKFYLKLINISNIMRDFL